MTEASPIRPATATAVAQPAFLAATVAPGTLSRAAWAALTTRTASLRARHAVLERRIEDERKRVRPDDLRLKRFKRAKLAIKDELARLEQMVRMLRDDRVSRPA